MFKAMFSLRSAFALSALALSLGGCQPRDQAPDASDRSLKSFKVALPQRPPAGKFETLSPAADAIWEKHLASLDKQPIQKACRPFRVAAQGPHKGSVLLYYGFTACPQQYWELASMLAANGFNVFVPLLPGHGRNYHLQKGIAVDDFSTLPADGEYVKYKTLAAEMTKMMRDEKGLKVVGGLSLGGVIAASAVVQAPAAYDRALLMTPLFNVVEAKRPYLPPANAVIPGHSVDWGRDCELERQGGRGGICQFQIRHVRAGQRLGEETLAAIGQVETPIQIVGVEGDQAANNGAIATAIHKLRHGQGCLYQHGVSHSMLSRYDGPDDKKFWLDSLESQTLRYISTGQFFDRSQPWHELGLMRCFIS